MKTNLFAAGLAVASLALTVAAHAQTAPMVQTNPATGKPVVMVTPMASPMDKYNAAWLYSNLDSREVKRYQAMGLTDSEIKGSANIAMRTGLEMDYVARQLREVRVPIYTLASWYGVNTKWVDSDIPGMGVETMSVMTAPAPMSGMMSK